MKPTTATINQELKDFKETYKTDILEIKETLNDIHSQTKKTNGRVTKIETKQEGCPARNAFKVENRNASNSNFIAIITVIISLITVIVGYIIFCDN